MPTYEYACEKCGHAFEFFQSMTDQPLSTCPKERCKQKTWGKGRVKRGIGGGAGLIFKGSGFYITDYRSENYKAAAKKDSTASSGSSSGTSGGSGGAESKTTPAKSDAKSSPAKPSST